MSIKRVVIVIAVLLLTVISANAQSSPEDPRGTPTRARYIFPVAPRVGAVRAVPANDNFASAAVVNAALPYTDTVQDFDQATGETGELPGACITDTNGIASIWYSYTPAANSAITIDTHGSTFDTVVGVYTGLSVNALTEIRCNDNFSVVVDAGYTSMVVNLNVSAGTTYMIRVAAQDVGEPGDPLLEPGDFSVITIKPTPGAVSFTVDTTADAVDTNIGDGVCDAVGVGCTLRAAINEANASQPGSTITLPTGLYMISKSIPDDPFNPGSRLSEDASINGDLDFISAVTITGAGPQSTIIDGGGGLFDGALEFFSGANVTISGVTIRNGNRIAGGGVRLNSTAAVTLNNVWVTGNTAAFGGGVTVEGGALTVKNSAITGNMALGGGDVSGNGGGIEVRDYAASNVAINLTNVTISSNTAVTPVVPWDAVCETPDPLPAEGYIFAAKGGGVYFGPTAGSTLTATFNNVTVAGNSAWCGGGIFTDTGVAVLTSNTLIGDNTATTSPDCRGDIGSVGSNVIENSLGCTTAGPDIVNQDVRLNGLFLNAPGNTPTHLPRSSSPARNAAIASGCALTDQRDISRPQAAQCDIGALEALNVVPGAFALVSPTHESMFPSAAELTEFVWQASDVNAFSYVVTLDDISSGIPVMAFSAPVRSDQVCVAGTCTLPFSGSLADGFYRYKVTAYADTNATASTTSHLVQVDSVAGLPNLLANGGFETKAANGQAAKWNAKKVSGEKRICNTTVTYAYKENCAYLFRGGKLESSSLKQVLNINGMAFEANNKFRLSFFAQPGPAINASVMLKVVYTRKSITPNKFKIMLPTGDQTWIPLSGEVVLKHQRVERVLLIFKHYSKKGKLFIDEVRTIYIDDSVVATPLVAATRDSQNGGLLPPPAAPDGFRGNN